MNELTIPKTNPKPRKEDVIKALVVIARNRYEDERRAYAQERDRLEANYTKLLLAFFRKSPKSFSVKVTAYGSVNELEFKASDSALPENVATAKDAWKKLPAVGAFDEQEVKAAIREELTERVGVESLLSNAEFQKGANTFLSAIL